ncbi:aminotransferase class V-fold PLP-dependent enzyme [Botrimarina hoheduenensis]|uniref:Cysteine desulfurase n=1 Tax=Botrimarina hoheduenensis TaxID=2528000 RepID=A0A5C5W7F0_9BACT|nr:cysteine desulfurase [Botrimarina hoheduenensis]TWT46836.1 putative cysteine desulfurase [Botrimarina hoheduenensis]
MVPLTDFLLDASLRDDFPLLAQDVHPGQPLVFLDNAASSQRPRQVIDAIVHCYEHDYANVHRGIHVLSERSTDAYELARRKTQAFLAAEHAHEVIFTAGTTAGINTVARSWGDANVHAGDELLLTPMEHHSNLVPWFQLAERTGAVIRHMPMSDDGVLQLDRLDEVLTERTKLVAFTAVSNTLGTINPVEALCRRARAVGAVSLVDAAQSAPHLTTNVQQMGCDFLVFSGHKLCGPSGVGVLYGRETLLETMPPFLGGGSMINRVYDDRFTPADLPAKFEAGTPPIAGAIGLGAALDYLTAIGLERIAAHEHTLVERAWSGLSQIAGIRLLGPAPGGSDDPCRAGLVSFVLDRPHAHDIAQLLDRRGIAVRAGHHCTQPLHDRMGIAASTRASFYLYNTPAEVDLLIAALGEVRERFRPTGRRRRGRIDA